MRISLDDLLETYKRGVKEGESHVSHVEEATASLVQENTSLKTENARLIEGLSALAGQAEKLKGVCKPDLGPDRQVGRDTALRFCDTLDPNAEYVKREDVLELFFQLDPRIRGPLAVRYPEMVHQRKP